MGQEQEDEDDEYEKEKEEEEEQEEEEQEQEQQERDQREAELHRQFLLLSRRLQQAATEREFAAWRDASGTEIMKDVFTSDRLYNGCAEFLYLFQHCATKTCCEAVLESMGSVWDKAADPRRHPVFSVSAQEGVIAWGAPQAYMPEAAAYCVRALWKKFGGRMERTLLSYR